MPKPSLKPRPAPTRSKPGPAKKAGAESWKGLIVKTPGVLGGSARIVQTRVPVWVLVNRRQFGHSDKGFLEDYPFLTAEQLAAAWAYAKEHAQEIAEEIRIQTED